MTPLCVTCYTMFVKTFTYKVVSDRSSPVLQLLLLWVRAGKSVDQILPLLWAPQATGNVPLSLCFQAEQWLQHVACSVMLVGPNCVVPLPEDAIILLIQNRFTQVITSLTLYSFYFFLSVGQILLKRQKVCLQNRAIQPLVPSLQPFLNRHFPPF